MLEQSRIRRQFAKAAATYDAVAVVQRLAGDRLLERLSAVIVGHSPQCQPQQVLDVGCGTGYVTWQLQRLYPKATITGVDLAAPMLQRARQGGRFWQRNPVWICASGEQLPLPSASVDLVISNLMLQWCPDWLTLLGEWRRVLRPGGALLVTTLGAATLHELRASWAAVDAAPHVHPFPVVQVLGDALVQTGFSGVVADREVLTLTYPDAVAVMRDLQQLGAGNALMARRRGLTGKGKWQAMQAAYETYRRAEDGKLPASFEILSGHAWAAAGPEPQTEVRFSPAQITRRKG